METPPPDLQGTPGRSRADMARGDSHPVFPVPGIIAPAAGEPTRSFAAKAGELKHSGIALPEGAPAWAARAYGEAAFQAALKEILVHAARGALLLGTNATVGLREVAEAVGAAGGGA